MNPYTLTGLSTCFNEKGAKTMQAKGSLVQCNVTLCSQNSCVRGTLCCVMSKPQLKSRPQLLKKHPLRLKYWLGSGFSKGLSVLELLICKRKQEHSFGCFKSYNWKQNRHQVTRNLNTAEVPVGSWSSVEPVNIQRKNDTVGQGLLFRKTPFKYSKISMCRFVTARGREADRDTPCYERLGVWTPHADKVAWYNLSRADPGFLFCSAHNYCMITQCRQLPTSPPTVTPCTLHANTDSGNPSDQGLHFWWIWIFLPPTCLSSHPLMPPTPKPHHFANAGWTALLLLINKK